MGTVFISYFIYFCYYLLFGIMPVLICELKVLKLKSHLIVLLLLSSIVDGISKKNRTQWRNDGY